MLDNEDPLGSGVFEVFVEVVDRTFYYYHQNFKF